MPTKKNNIPTGGFIRKQDDANNPLLPFSAEKQRAYDAGEITLLELISDDRHITDMPYYQDRYDFNTTTKYYENQDKPAINSYTQRLTDEIYYPESLQFGKATYATGLNIEKENEILDEIDKLRDDYDDGKITEADYEAKVDAYFDELERLNNEEIANYSFDPYKLGTPVKLDAEQARKNLKGPALDYFSSGDIYAIPVGDAYSTVYSREAGGRPNSFQFLGADFTQGDGYAALNDYLFPGTDKLAQSYILSKDPVLGLEDMFGMNTGTGYYSIDSRYPYEVTKEHIYLGNPTIEQIIDNPEKYKLELEVLREQSRGPDTYLFRPHDFDGSASFQYVNVPPGQPVELRSLPFDKDSYTGPLIPPKVDDYEYMEWERRTNPLTGDYEKMPVGPKYPQSSNYVWGVPVAFDKDSYIDRPSYPRSTKGDKLFERTELYANVNPNFTSSGGMTSNLGTYQQDDIFAIENYGGSRFNNILYSPEYRGYEVETTEATLNPEIRQQLDELEAGHQKEYERRMGLRDASAFYNKLFNSTGRKEQEVMPPGKSPHRRPQTEVVDREGNRLGAAGNTLYYYEDDEGNILYAADASGWGSRKKDFGTAQDFLKNLDEANNTNLFTNEKGKLLTPKVISPMDNPRQYEEVFSKIYQFVDANIEEGSIQDPTLPLDQYVGPGIIRKDLMSTQENTIDMKEEGGFTRKQDVPSVVDLRYMPTDYMSSFNPNAMIQSGQTNNPRLFRGNATGFPLKAGTEGANPELYITAGDVKFSPQSLYRTGQAIMPSVGVRGDVAYDRSLTPEVREDIFRYTGRNISPFNTRFNPYIEVSGPRGNTVTGGVSFGGQVTPGGQSGLSYNVGYRKTFPVRKTKVTNQNLAEGGIFQNPITSAMNSFEEAGNLMIQNQLTDVLSQQIDDTFGFNFIPRDENGCEIKLMFKAQEGGYSRNQGGITDILEGVYEKAEKIYDYGTGVVNQFKKIGAEGMDRVEEIITGANNPNYVNQDQSNLRKIAEFIHYDILSEIGAKEYLELEEESRRQAEAMQQAEAETETETDTETESEKQDDIYTPENFYLSQTYKESKFDPDAVSSTKAHKGLGQLGAPVVTDWYFNTDEKYKIKPTSDGKFTYKGKTYNTSEAARDAANDVAAYRANNEFNYFNPSLNAEVQMWAMNDLYNASFIDKPEENQPNEVRLAKALAAYNWGRGKTLDLLGDLKDQGVNIYENTDFIVNSEYFPKETRDYVNAILYNVTPPSWEEKGWDSYEVELNRALSNPDLQQYIDLYQTKQEGGFMENGGVLVSPEGVFDPNYIPGKPVIVPTENGVITTEGVPMDLVAVSDSGEIKYLPRNSGTHQFKGKVITEYPADMFYAKDGGLADWFKEEWVRIDTEGNITGPCGTMKKGKATTRCLPKKKAQSLTKAERKATARKKVRGSKKGKQFVSNTKKAKVKKKDTKRYEEGGSTTSRPLTESYVVMDLSDIEYPRESKAFTFGDTLSQYSTAAAASKALNPNDIRDFLESEGYSVSLTGGNTLSSDELSALNTYMTGQQSVMLDGGELPHQTFTRVTGLPWPEAKLRGYTDGSYEKNVALQNLLLDGKPLFVQSNNKNKKSFSEEEGLIEIDFENT